MKLTMTIHTSVMSPGMPCHRCGYDLRAQQGDAACPECGALVAEARRLSAIPARPPWRASDPRWRRRIVAGAWTLALLPVMDVLRASGWATDIPVPVGLGYRSFGRTLGDRLIIEGMVCQPLMFCIGVVLLFAKERGRRPGRLDWTRRWGVMSSYVTLLLAAAYVFTIAAFVCVGIAMLFLSMPSKEQPGATRWFVEVAAAYLHHGPQPSLNTFGVLVASSSVAVLLACVSLFDAVRSCGPKWIAAFLVAPLACFSVARLVHVGGYQAGLSGRNPNATFEDGV